MKSKHRKNTSWNGSNNSSFGNEEDKSCKMSIPNNNSLP